VTATIQGQDYSHYNSDVSFPAAIKAGQQVFYCKSSEGSEANAMRDITYEAKRLACVPTGAPFAPYHFLKMAAPASAQAAWFKKCAPTPTSLNPVGDIEQHPFEPPNSGIPIAKKRAHVHDFLLRIEDEFRRRPIIYTAPYYWRDNIGDVSWAIDYDFIVAGYLFYKGPIPATFVPYWPGPRTIFDIPRENIIGWQWAGDIPNGGKYPWASGGQDFNTFDAEAIYALASFKPPLTTEDKVGKLWLAHPELN